MRKLLIGVCVGLVACACWAGGPKLHLIEIATGAKTSGTNTLTDVSGYLEDIQVSVSDGVSTGSVWVAMLRPDSTVAAVNIATNVVTDEKLFRPVVDGTDILGAALTSDPPRRMYLMGETLRCIVQGSPTNKTWRFRVKTTDQ